MALAALFALVSFGAWIFIIIHAFQRSVGTGFLVLCVPCYVLYYAFSQFEHPRKNLILAAFLGGSVISSMLYGAVAAQVPQGMQVQTEP